jgi:hypothetical protein
LNLMVLPFVGIFGFSPSVTRMGTGQMARPHMRPTVRSEYGIAPEPYSTPLLLASNPGGRCGCSEVDDLVRNAK